MQKHLRRAIELASTHSYDLSIGFRLCAIIVRGGSIVSVGFNKLATNGFVRFVVNAVPDGRPFSNTHAEMAAVLAARDVCDLKNAKLYVARIKATGVGLARPCDACVLAARMHGIKRAIYTIDDDEWGVLNTAG